MSENKTYSWNNVLDLFAVLFGGIMGMLPIFAIDILKIGPEGLGLLRTMPAVGGVLTGIILTQLPPINNAGKNLIISMIVFGSATAIFAVSSILWLSLLMLFIYGAADMVSVYIRQTIIPIVTPDDMRGRVGMFILSRLIALMKLVIFALGSLRALSGLFLLYLLEVS